MKLFGTDGIRGKFNESPINHVQLVKIGYAFAKSLFDDQEGKIYISNDGRESSSDIESALSDGIIHQGSEVISIGLLPTPALSICLHAQRLEKELCAGIQITASHNPYHDNGVKFFDKNGFKIDSVLEKIIENSYFNQTEEIYVKDKKNSKSDSAEIFNKRYINYINDYFLLKVKGVESPKRKFNILVDCANGATSKIISEVLKDSFINIIPIYNEPSGKNINNNCGATHTDTLKKFIFDFNSINANSLDYDRAREPRDLKIDLGVAFDGDGDRVIFVSPSGKEINGDDTLYILALFHKKFNKTNTPIVGTQMTNYGIQNLYKKNNIKFIETEVGDKHVLKEMVKSGSSFGGESSGHILIPVANDFYIGDGIITLISLLEVIFKQDKNIDELKEEIISVPSKLFNTKVTDKKIFLEDKINIKVFLDLEKMMGPNGRLLLRPSGTENLIRLLIEHEDAEQIEILSKYFYDNINKNTIV
jgi:phosphoglucosamine mutase